MTTLEIVKNELENNNLPTTGVYEELPKIVFSVVMRILHFGEEVLDDHSLGWKTKEVALKLAKNDGRKPTICPVTYKTILV